MDIHCVTNLDLRCEMWPSELPCRPVVGDYIKSGTAHPIYKDGYSVPISHVNLELQVCAVRFVYNKYKWTCEVELTLPSRWERMTDFYTWYAKILGTSVASFI